MTGVVSTVGVTAIPIPAFAVGVSGNEASVPARTLAKPAALPAERSAPALPTPVWPAASTETVTLPGPSDAAAASTSVSRSAVRMIAAGSVVSVGAAAVPRAGVDSPDLGTGTVAAPASVTVRVLPRAAVAPIGGQGLGIVVDRADGVRSTGQVSLSINYSTFAYASGGDYAGRLRLVMVPACALTTPNVAACDTVTNVPDAVNDTVSHTITATVQADVTPAASSAMTSAAVTGGMVMTLAAGESSDSGNFRQTPMSQTGTWSVSPGAGAFTYNLPLTMPPPAEGTAPDMSLDYDSQSVDGLTSAANTQASTVGLGWSLTSAYIERGYRDCLADGQPAPGEDMCWYSPYAGSASGHAADSVYNIVLNGQSSQLVPDVTTAGRFHLTGDPGWYVIKHGSPNQSPSVTTSTEWWQVFSPDGTIYDLGHGADYKTGVADNSVLTEPVFGNGAGEPCNGSWPTTGCTQAWKWMLDTVIDPNEVVASYQYTLETNSYRSLGGSTNQSRTYDMNANLAEIDYGWAEQLTGTNYTDKAVFDFVGRCATRMGDADPLHDTVASCPSISSDPGDYDDVPTDLMCSDPTGDTSGCEGGDGMLYAPSFFSTQMLWNIKTYTLTTTGAATEVMDYQLKHDLDSTSATDALWFDYLEREGFDGTGTAITLPSINFNGSEKNNTISGSSTTLDFKRIITIMNDIGGVTTVTYGLPDACTTSTEPSESNNIKDCYKQSWTPDGATNAKTGWFNKYLVTEVDNDPNVGTGSNWDGDPVQKTFYDYSGGKPGWRYPQNPLVEQKAQSWTEWRGYSNVVVTTGVGVTVHSANLFVFQGLDGDRTNVANTSTPKSVTVTGSSSGPAVSFTDSAWLADQVYEESDRDGAGSSWKYVVHKFGFVYQTAAYSGLPNARYVNESETDTYDFTSTATHANVSTWRKSETQTQYDATAAATVDADLPVSSENDGVTTTAADDTCDMYGYALNANPSGSRWMVVRDEDRHYSGTACVNRTAAEQDGYTATLFDGAASVAANLPIDGNPTEVDTYTGATTFTSVKHTYDVGGRITSDTDGIGSNGAAGHTTMTVYNPVAGWPTSTVVSTPVPDIIADDFGGHATSSTAALVTTTSYSPVNGQALSVTDSNGSTTTGQYDTVGRLIQVVRPKDSTTTPTTRYTYTIPVLTSGGVPAIVSGPPSTEQDALRTGTTYMPTVTYIDGLGQTREVQTAAPGGTGRDVVTTRYDSSGYVEGGSDPFYNASAVGSAMVNPALITVPAYHDNIIDWDGRTTESQLLDDNVKATAEDTTTAYFPDKTVVTDPDGNVTTTNLDVFGDTTSVVQATPAAVTTSYTYDDKQQLTGVTDANGDVTGYGYDWSGQRILTVTPDNGRSCAYDDNDGDPQYSIASAPNPCPADPTGTTTRISTVYDALDRPTSTWQGTPGTGTELTSDTYDTATLGKGQPASSTSYSGASAFVETVDGYDNESNSLGTTVTVPAIAGALAGTYNTTTPSYNAAGQSLTVGYPAINTGSTALPAETVTTAYNNLDDAATLTSGLGTYVTATGYANYGPLTSRTYGTGTLTAKRGYTWDQTTGWLTNIQTSVTNGSTTTPAQNDTYGYDKAGNVTEIASTAGTPQQQCFGYDPLNRVTRAFTTTSAAVPTTPVAGCGSATANHTGGISPYDLSYTYDSKGLGNLSAVVDTIAGTTAAYNYPADAATNPTDPHGVTKVTHKVTATGAVIGTDAYGYNGNGDMTSRSVAGVASTVAWNPLQQLASVTSGSSTTSYTYDAAGNLLLRKGTSSSTLYLQGEELNLASAVVTPTRYYTSGGSTVAMRVGGGGGNGTLTWLTADGQSSTQVAINTTTGATTQQRYLPFGAQRGTQGPTVGTQNGYLGQAFDPGTALIQDGARFYDPSLARFLSPDPDVDTSQPQDLNAYAYSLNNPITFSDPTGLFALNCELGKSCNPNNDKNDSPTKVHAQSCNAACKAILAKWKKEAAAKAAAAAAKAAAAKAAAAKAAAAKAAAQAEKNQCIDWVMCGVPSGVTDLGKFIWHHKVAIGLIVLGVYLLGMVIVLSAVSGGTFDALGLAAVSSGEELTAFGAGGSAWGLLGLTSRLDAGWTLLTLFSPPLALIGVGTQIHNH